MRNLKLTDIHIFTGPDQVRVSDFKTLMKNINFKRELVQFIIDDWARDELSTMFENKTVYVSLEKCYKYQVTDGKVILQIVTEFNTEGHEEADSKVAFFISRLSDNLNVVVRCADTDILIILLGNMHKFQKNLKIWLQYGTGNHCRYINVSEIYEKLGEKVALGLPGFHALTGCDYNPAFFGKGKAKPYKIFISDEKYQTAFYDMADPNKHEEVMNIIEDFVCRMYATAKRKMTHIKKINEARVRYFYESYGMLDDANKENFKKKMLAMDACSFPPCLAELEQQVLRATYITSVWMNAEKSIPTNFDPMDYGWKNENGLISFKWFDGDEMPEKVFDIVAETCPKGNAFKDNILNLKTYFYIHFYKFFIDSDAQVDDILCEVDVSDESDDEDFDDSSDEEADEEYEYQMDNT